MLNIDHTRAVRAELERGNGHAAGAAEAEARSATQPAPVLRIAIYADPALPREGAAEIPEIALLVPGLGAGARESGGGREEKNGTRGADHAPAQLGVTPLSRARNGRRSTGAHEPAPQLERVQREVADREAELDRVQELADSERARLERRKSQLAQLETELQERRRDLDQREAALEVREAEREVAFELREDSIERRERELSALEEQLRRKENEVAAYVAQVQQHLARGQAGPASA